MLENKTKITNFPPQNYENYEKSAIVRFFNHNSEIIEKLWIFFFLNKWILYKQLWEKVRVARYKLFAFFPHNSEFASSNFIFCLFVSTAE